MERLMLDREPDAKREEQVPEGDAKESGQSGSAWLETLRTIVIAVLIAVGVRTFAYEPFNIPSSSMEPTLMVGDYLLVSRSEERRVGKGCVSTCIYRWARDI